MLTLHSENCNNFLITQWISKFQSSLNSLHQSSSADTIIAAVAPTVQDLAGMYMQIINNKMSENED